VSQSICRNCLVLNGCLLPTPQLCKESFHQSVYELFRVPFDYNMLQIYCRVKSRQPPIFKIISPWFTHQWIDFREASPQALLSSLRIFGLSFDFPSISWEENLLNHHFSIEVAMNLPHLPGDARGHPTVFPGNKAVCSVSAQAWRR
jgi:hypothetical protein